MENIVNTYMSSENKKDSCFECKNFKLCFFRRDIEKTIRRGVLTMINISGDSRPGGYSDIYVAVASACKEFKIQE